MIENLHHPYYGRRGTGLERTFRELVKSCINQNHPIKILPSESIQIDNPNGKSCTYPDFYLEFKTEDGRVHKIFIEVGSSTHGFRKHQQAEVAYKAGVKYVQLNSTQIEWLCALRPNQLYDGLTILIFDQKIAQLDAYNRNPRDLQKPSRPQPSSRSRSRFR